MKHGSLAQGAPEGRLWLHTEWRGVEPLEPRILLSATPQPLGPLLDEVHAAAGLQDVPTFTPGFDLIAGSSALTVLDVSEQFAADLYEQGLRGAEWNGQQIVVDPDRWIVDFSILSGDIDEQMREAELLLGGLDTPVTVTQHLGDEGLLLVESGSDFVYESFVSSLLAIDSEVWVEPDIVLAAQEEPTFVPNDPNQGNQWAWGVIDAYEAWDITTGSRDIAVAILDTGTDWMHQDLAANIWTNPGEIEGDGIDNDGNGYVDDFYGWNFHRNNNDYSPGSHGTHVSGTVGAVGNNGVGVTGVNQQVSLIGLDIFDDNNEFTSSSRYIPALNYIADLKAAGTNVVASNNSYGSLSNSVSSTVRAAIERNRDYNILFVAAAGNDANDNDVTNHMPGGQPVENVIAVASSTSSDGASGFTNFGDETVDIAAPGSSIRSTTPNNGYANFSGTSMASPHVAGLAGLVYSIAPDASYHQIQDVIYEGGDDWTQVPTITGKRINANNALLLAQTQVNGTLYADGNGNGVLNAGESSVSGFNSTTDSLGDWKVYVDADGDQQFDAAESFTDSNGNGHYDVGEGFTDANTNGVWDDAETHAVVQFNGNYTLILPAGTYDVRVDGPSGISLTSGANGFNITIAAQQQINNVDIGIFESTAPAATLATTTTYPVTGSSEGRFQVTYTDDTGIDLTSLGNDDVRVTRGGFTATATLVGYTASNGDATVTAQYSFTPPGGTWDAADDGSFTVHTNAGGVADVFGNTTPDQNIGSFTIQRVTPIQPNFTEGFETGALGEAWHTLSDPNGRIEVTSNHTPHAGNYHLAMDAVVNGTYAVNQAVLHVDLAGYTDAELSFWWEDHSDETDAFDAVGISVDQGQSFTLLADLAPGSAANDTPQQVVVDLDATGLTFTEDTWIVFQQYDNFSLTTDGIAFDDISVTATPAPAAGINLNTGVISNVTDNWQTVTLPTGYTSMVVVATPMYGPGDAPAVTRIRNATGNSFEIKLQSPDGSPVSGYDVQYIVVEEGVYTQAQDGITLEAVKYTSTETDYKQSWVGESRAYQQGYTNPVVLGQVMSENDTGWSTFWSSGASRLDVADAGNLTVGKHTGEENAPRANETIGYIVAEAGTGMIGNVEYTVGVGGELVRGVDNAPPFAYDFTGVQSVDGAVVSQAGMDGRDGGWAVLWGGNPVTTTQLQLAIDEDNVVDAERSHGEEQVSYFAFGEVVEVITPNLATGVVTGVGSSWQTVNLGSSYDSMVVVATVVLEDGDLPAVTRVRNASGSSFELSVQNPSGTPLTDYTVHYTVVEEGVYTAADNGITLEAVKVDVGTTDHATSWIGEAATYANTYSAPVVVGQVMSDNDADWSAFWSRGANDAEPASPTELYIGKHVGEDTDTTRATETIGYIVIESGSGSIDGIDYVAGVGNDTVRGVENAPPFNYAISGITGATSAVASLAGMDGGDGGYAALFGPGAVSDTNLQLVADEDQVGDTERRHTTEQVSYVVFAAAGGAGAAATPSAAEPAAAQSTTQAATERINRKAALYYASLSPTESAEPLGSELDDDEAVLVDVLDGLPIVS